jgi:hypothetical protein
MAQNVRQFTHTMGEINAKHMDLTETEMKVK